MYETHVIPMLLVFALPVAIVAFGLIGVMAYRTRRMLNENLALTTRLVERIAVAERKSHAAVAYGTDQARRIAWLESRVRQKREPAGPVISGLKPNRSEPARLAELADPADPANLKRTSMIQQRYRVLALARRGLDIATIAETLGIPHGEVELIIALNCSV
jgi:hypothetical protein